MATAGFLPNPSSRRASASPRFTALRSACSTSARRSGEAPSSQAAQVRASSGRCTLPRSFRLLATLRRTTLAGSSLSRSSSSSTRSGLASSQATRLAQGSRRRVPSDTSRRTCGFRSFVQRRRKANVRSGSRGDVRPDAGLGAEPLGQLVLRAHRQVEVVEPALGHEQRVRQVEERRHAGPHQLVRRVLRPQRPQQHLDRLGVGGRQVVPQRPGDVPAAVEQLERLQPGDGLLDERPVRKARVHPRDVSPPAAARAPARRSVSAARPSASPPRTLDHPHLPRKPIALPPSGPSPDTSPSGHLCRSATLGDARRRSAGEVGASARRVRGVLTS